MAFKNFAMITIGDIVTIILDIMIIIAYIIVSI